MPRINLIVAAAVTRGERPPASFCSANSRGGSSRRPQTYVLAEPFTSSSSSRSSSPPPLLLLCSSSAPHLLLLCSSSPPRVVSSSWRVGARAMASILRSARVIGSTDPGHGCLCLKNALYFCKLGSFVCIKNKAHSSMYFMNVFVEYFDIEKSKTSGNRPEPLP